MFQYRNGENIIINDSHSIEDTNYKKSLIVILRFGTTLKCFEYFCRETLKLRVIQKSTLKLMVKKILRKNIEKKSLPKSPKKIFAKYFQPEKNFVKFLWQEKVPVSAKNRRV